MSELNKALAYVHSSLAQESSLCYTLICLCQDGLGSVSMRDPLWERGVKSSHPGGMGGRGGLTASLIPLRFPSSWKIQEEDSIPKLFCS